MRKSERPGCRLIHSGATFEGKQGFSYFSGISATSAGSTAICMNLLVIPPGGRAKAHRHEQHETAIYMVSGEVHTWYGDDLRELCVARAGDFLFIPPGVPHLPVNLSNTPATCLIARSDPNEQESVVLMPELEDRIPALARRAAA
jgi:uncharacterized RmlC-like cupin family protein